MCYLFYAAIIIIAILACKTAIKDIWEEFKNE